MLTIQNLHQTRNGKRIEVDLSLNGKTFNLFFESLDIALAPRLEGLLVLTLAAAMNSKTGTIRAQGNVSAEFLDNLSRAQDLLLSWKPSYQRVAFEGVTVAPALSEGGKGVGVFFSLGLDSFYSLLKHIDEITHLVFIHGFDLSLHDQGLRRESALAVHRVAQQYDKQVIEVVTNARTFLEPLTRWSWSYGATLACVGYLLNPLVHRMYIAAAHTTGHTPPRGTHVDLDPLWGSPGLEFIHDGLEATRVQKARLLGEHEIALKTLRVCTDNPNDLYNCGICPKCIRTMAAMQAAGVLEHCTTFSNPLDLRRVANLEVSSLNSRLFLTEILEDLQESGREPELAQALQHAFEKPTWQSKIKKSLRKIKTYWIPRRRFQRQ